MQLIDKPIEKGIILRRVRDPVTLVADVATNVPHNIVYHSPTGFEWGYYGSGPAELALNLAELVVQKAQLRSEQGIHCSDLAWNVKQHVKELLIGHLSQESNHYIPWKLVCYAVFDALIPSDDYYLYNRRKLLEYIGEL